MPKYNLWSASFSAVVTSMIMLIPHVSLANSSLTQTNQTAEQLNNNIPTSANDQMSLIVDAEYPAYDANKDSTLDLSEFSRWMIALKNQELKAANASMTQEQLDAWVKSAFKSADADESQSVSKPELLNYLRGNTH